MRIHGVLSFYDESPHWLATAVAGFGRFCDTIVAVDGAYELYPNGRPKSHPSQVEAIVHTAEAMGCDVLLYQPTKVWAGNEVEKRNYCLDLVNTLATFGDWLCIFDADYHVLHLDQAGLLAALASAHEDVAGYPILDGKDLLADPDLAVFASNNAAPVEWTWGTRDLFRWDDTLRVGPAHDSYSINWFPDIGPARRWLRGRHEPLLDALDLSPHLAVYHRKQDRALVRKQAAEAYYEARAAAGIEVAA